MTQASRERGLIGKMRSLPGSGKPILSLSLGTRMREIVVAIDTKTVQGRREVYYSSFQDLLADAERMVAANARPIGNWTAGQIFTHLAGSFDSSIDGSNIKFPWYFRVMAKFMKKKLLNMPMPPGFTPPGEAARKLVPPPTSTEDGLAALHSAVARQERETNRAVSPVLGVLTRDEWTRLHLNHAALHMSFLVP